MEVIGVPERESVTEKSFKEIMATRQTNEQNRSRDMEIKNKLTVTRGEG